MKNLLSCIEKWKAELPPIDGCKIVFTWDVEWAEGETPRFLVRHKNQIILYDETCFENATEFALVVELLSKVYSGRMYDLVPLRDGCLYGHDAKTVKIVNEARQKCRDKYNSKEGK
ncbi:hypothetical protein HOD41_01385 [bacterium]|jgi:hypothetical protein|nr:hypothetical protein [bacterium]MBT7310576.1 hypothetical protein [bacterium]